MGPLLYTNVFHRFMSTRILTFMDIMCVGDSITGSKASRPGERSYHQMPSSQSEFITIPDPLRGHAKSRYPATKVGPYTLDTHQRHYRLGATYSSSLIEARPCEIYLWVYQPTFLPRSALGPPSEAMPSCSWSFSSFVHVRLLYILLLVTDAPPFAAPLPPPLPPLPPDTSDAAGLAARKSRSNARGVVPACSRIHATSDGVRGSSDPVEKNADREVGVPLCEARVTTRRRERTFECHEMEISTLRAV